jgi:hypothetical protein
VLDARSHSVCDVLVYIPEHRLLCMGDTTIPLFPTWPDSSRDRTLDVLRKDLVMTQAGSVALLADGHGDRCYRGSRRSPRFCEASGTTILLSRMRWLRSSRLPMGSRLARCTAGSGDFRVGLWCTSIWTWSTRTRRRACRT